MMALRPRLRAVQNTYCLFAPSILLFTKCHWEFSDTHTHWPTMQCVWKLFDTLSDSSKHTNRTGERERQRDRERERERERQTDREKEGESESREALWSCDSHMRFHTR